jgi:hypothetical protein
MKYTKTIRASKSASVSRKSAIKASSRARARRAVKADDEIIEDEIIDEEIPADGGEVSVDDAASTLLFEAEDVAELVAEVAGAPVDVTVEDDGTVQFAVGDDTFTVTPEGDEEVVESSRRIVGKRPIKASARGSARRPARRPVSASTSARAAARRASARRAARR